ncbi:MAG TPA: hypothetical protein VM901_05105 [Bdellovibrionota bacterium]|jgi:hypothetical protein|nr:hypothetical protein [Bdellovibrionota bacterium]
MDLGGIGRSLKAGLIKVPTTPGIGEQKESAPDRDPTRQHYAGPESQTQLTPEQEEEALKILNDLDAFKAKSLVATLVRADGNAPHIVVKDFQGRVVRQLPYEQIVEIFLKRNTESASGMLLKRSA